MLDLSARISKSKSFPRSCWYNVREVLGYSCWRTTLHAFQPSDLGLLAVCQRILEHPRWAGSLFPLSQHKLKTGLQFLRKPCSWFHVTLSRPFSAPEDTQPCLDTRGSLELHWRLSTTAFDFWGYFAVIKSHFSKGKRRGSGFWLLENSKNMRSCSTVTVF